MVFTFAACGTDDSGGEATVIDPEAMNAGKYRGRTDITSIVIPEGVTSIDSYAFQGCTGLTSVTIPNSVMSIWRDAFQGCTSLTSITIPASVTSIGYNGYGRTISPFSGCSSLEAITVAEGNARYNSKNGCNAIINTYFDTNTLVAGCKNTVIPEGVTSIGHSAFYGCTSLTSITIPNSVTNIDSYAFGCTGLTSITIPNSVTTIDSEAFYGCTNLNNIIVSTSGWKKQNYNTPVDDNFQEELKRGTALTR